MARCQCVLLCALLAFSIVVDPALGRKAYGRGGSHSYPSSRGGLSGSGSGSHSYPRSPGLSGSGSHGYPNSGSHGYPSSGGLSGSGSPGQAHGYPSNTQTNGHGYPTNNGLSGGARNPAGHTTVINHNYNYHYSPPQQIRYTPTHGGAPVSYPVYHGTPPTYVYQYKDSGSKYSSLLAGLALFNLGALAGTAFSHRSSSSYKPQPGEVCKFGVKKDNGDYEETRIDCQLITSFIFEAEAKQNASPNNTVVTTTVTNVTVVNTTNEVPAPPAPVPEATPNYTMLPNGTLVPVNVTSASETPENATTASQGEANNTTADASVTSSIITTTITNTTVVNAIDVKGPPVQVTPGMQCYIIRHSPTTNLKKTVPCALLQTYSEKSLTKNSATVNTPVCTLLAAVVIAFAIY